MDIDENINLSKEKKNVSILENETDIVENEEKNNLGNNNIYNLIEDNLGNLEKYKNKEKMKKNMDNDNNKEFIICEYKRLTEIQLQIIFEQEIINIIVLLYKAKKYCVLEDYIFIHIQYLLVMKKNYYLALYFIGKYEKCGIKWSFDSQYFLYELKQFIITSFFNKTNLTNIDENANKFRKDNHFMKEIINYFLFSAILKNLIIEACG